MNPACSASLCVNEWMAETRGFVYERYLENLSEKYLRFHQKFN